MMIVSGSQHEAWHLTQIGVGRSDRVELLHQDKMECSSVVGGSDAGCMALSPLMWKVTAKQPAMAQHNSFIHERQVHSRSRDTSR